MTDPREAGEATEDGSLSAKQTPWPSEGFEDRRALAAIRGRLFGSAPTLHIGRFRIDRRLGAGGMGEVYLGFDAQLDRKVAIKCVRPEIDDAVQRERLRREARALAQLSDPNVVVVYEVGEHERQTYIAMEFVEGQTLAAWLERPRSWAELLDRFIAAGRGLAAAHSAGVVHRDFKPDNVLIGDDGRVRVADFGLALADPIAGTASDDGLASKLTDVGKLAGTVRYMPLEQLRGETVGPATDQFAFCVSLYEALWGEPPFAIASVAARIEALELEQVRVPPRGLPRRLWTILRRGLARAPERRWPDLPTLLDALASVGLRRRRIALAFAGLGAATLLGGWPLLARETRAPSACQAIETELAGVWDADTAARARAAFEQAEAAADFTRIDAALDRWAEAWLEQRATQCEAAQAKRDDEALARARRRCLEIQRRRVAVFGRELTQAGPALIERAVVAATELPDPRRCTADRVVVDAEPPEQRERADELRGELAELAQLRLLGRAEPERARALVVDAEALGSASLLAEAVAEQGLTELAAGSTARGLAALERAGDLALAGDLERLLAQIWLDLAAAQLGGHVDRSLAARHAKLAAAAWARLDPDLHTRSRLAFVAGQAAALEGDHETAAAEYRAALRELGDAQSTVRPGLLVKLAELSDPPESFALRREALELAEQMWGPDHPHTAGYAFILAQSLHAAGEREQARPLLVRAVETWTGVHGEPHPDLARAHESLVALALADYRESDDEAEREAALERAQTHALEAALIRAQTLPAVHRSHGDAAMQLSRIAALRQDRSTALALARDALAHYQATLAPDAAELRALRLDIADNELGLGHLARAEAGYLELVAHTDEPAELARAQLGLLEIAVRRGQLDLASDRIRAIEGLGEEQLGPQVLSLAILAAVVDLRRGCEPCTNRNRPRLRRLVAEAGWSRAVIAAWLGELGLDARETAALGFEEP